VTRYFIFFSFKGTSYHGWQIQPRSLTVQEILDDKFSLLLGEKIRSTGAGRTDAGVHAAVFCAHIDCRAPDLDEKNNLIFRLNRLLPDDIAVKSIRKVLPEANARFSAVSRTYKYYIARAKDPFDYDATWFIYGELDRELMNKASLILPDYSDFTSFSRLHSDNKTNICRILRAGWEEEDHRLIFTIRADRFLRNMVRAIVGTMIELGKHKITLKVFEEIIQARNRSAAGTSAPAKGLFLTDIEYPAGLFA